MVDGLTINILHQLEKLNIEIQDCRGHGYDNGSNMAGKNLGVQKRILDLNSRAFFVPCAAHKLNLVLLDVAESCVKSVTFFGTLQSLNLFATKILGHLGSL